MDTDQLFKELLRTFFREFLELFFPEVATRLDFGRVAFLDKELFTDFPEGSLREADTLAEVYTQDGQPELVLFHIEVQARRSGDFPYRMWEYFCLLRMRYRRPVFPVVLYLSPGAGGLTAEIYTENLFGREINRFRYDVVGLPDLAADEYRERDNPLGPALGAVMRQSAAGRLRQKYEALLRTARDPLDDARRALLATVIEAFLPLRGEEETEFASLLAQSEAQEVREMITVYEQRGIEKGIAQGLQQGIQQGIEQGVEQGIELGVLRGKRETLLKLMRAKFGDLTPTVVQTVEDIASSEELERLSERVLTAATLDDMGLTSE